MFVVLSINDNQVKLNYINTVDSGIDMAPGINVAHGTFGKNIKRSP